MYEVKAAHDTEENASRGPCASLESHTRLFGVECLRAQLAIAQADDTDLGRIGDHHPLTVGLEVRVSSMCGGLNQDHGAVQPSVNAVRRRYHLHFYVGTFLRFQQVVKLGFQYGVATYRTAQHSFTDDERELDGWLPVSTACRCRRASTCCSLVSSSSGGHRTERIACA